MARAAVLTRPGTFEIQEVALPRPAPGQVRVRVEGCGICASSLPVWEGREWFHYPLKPGAPGHEGWGRVDEVGDGVTDRRPGDRVAFLSDGSYAEYEVVPASSTVVLPEALADRPFPGEPLGCAMNVFTRSDIQPGQDVAIVGVGFLGAVVAQLAARAGARVVAISRRPFSRQVALQMGAQEALPMEEATGEFDRVVEAAGLQSTLDLATRLTKERGMLIIAGYHQDGPRTVDMQTWNWRGLDVVNAHERDPARYVEGIRGAVQAVAEGRLDPWPLLSHRYPLDRIDEAFRQASSREAGFLKAMVTL